MYLINRCFQSALIIASLLTTASCNLPGLQDDTKKPARRPWSAGPAPNGTGFDFQKNCGIDVFADTASIVYSQRLKSLNLIYEGSGNALTPAFRVEALATLDIQSLRSSTTNKIDVSLEQLINKNTGQPPLGDLIVTIGATVVTNAKAGTTVSTALPTGEWLKLTDGSNPEWKDLLCVITATKFIKVESKGGNHDFEFTPGYVSTINPMASAEQYKKELGTGRTFRMSVLTGIRDRQINGIVSFKPVNPTATFTDALTNRQYNVVADTAWEVTSQFESNLNKFDLINKTTTFYVSHSKKRFEAIVQKADKSALLTVNPDVVLLPVD